MPIIRSTGPTRFKPPINQDLAATPHARWLEGNDDAHAAELDAHESRIARLEQSMNEGARQTAVVNNFARSLSNRPASGGVPDGGLEDQLLTKLSDADGDADWKSNRAGGIPFLTFSIPSEVSYVELTEEYQPSIVDIQISSPSDAYETEIVFPDMYNSDYDLGLPYYVLSIYVYGHSVNLTSSGNVPTYLDHPSVGVMGFDTSTGTVTLPAGYEGQWFVVCNFQNNSAVAIPMNDDTYYETVGAPITAGAAPGVTATAAAGSGPTVTVSGTSTGGVVELVTGTSPTTTGWGELLTFNNPAWDSGTVPVLSIYPANQAAAALTHYGTRSGTNAEAVFDLTGIAASTTYLFHYSLLPFAAV